MRAPQRGVALITVLLVTSLALLLVASVLRGHRLLVHSTAQHLQWLTLRQAAQAAEAWAVVQLEAHGSAPERAMQLAQPFSLPGFEDLQVTVRIEDRAARMNVNALLVEGPVDEVLDRRWAALLNVLDIPLFNPRSLGQLSLRDIRQLRLIAGVEGHHLDRLAPHVAWLPPDAPLNINTASTVQWTALGLNESQVRSVLEQRPEQGYRSVTALIESLAQQGLTLDGRGLGLGSHWFRVVAQVQLDKQPLQWVSDLEWQPGSASLRVTQRRLLAPTDSEWAL